jgi:multidrug efflux system membrane fusion protein
MELSMISTFKLNKTSSIVLLSMGILAACNKTEVAQQKTTVPEVSVAEVIQQPINEWNELTSRLAAPETVDIRPRVSGYMDRVYFTEGAMAKKGEVLFQIDPRPFQAEVERVQAQLQQARANLDRATNDARRGQNLSKINAISAEQADSRNSAALEAKANYAAIKAQLDNANLNLSFTRIRSPIDGKVGRAEITAGNLVSAGQSLLTSVVSTDKVYAYFDADESLYLKYMDNNRQNIKTPVLLGLSNETGYPHMGKLDFLDNHINEQTGTIRGRAVFDNKHGLFTPGLYARLQLIDANTYPAVLVQDNAIGSDLGKKYVLVVDPQNTARYRTVELGSKVDGLRIVQSGLNKGDRIVVDGLQKASSGMKVRTDMVPMADEKTLSDLANINKRVQEGLDEFAAEQPSTPTHFPRG